MKYMYIIHVCFSMQALDGLFRENEKQEKLNKLEKRRNKLSELLLKETKEYEVHININFLVNDIASLIIIGENWG